MLTFTFIMVGIGILVLAGALYFILRSSSHVTVRDSHDHVSHNVDDFNNLHSEDHGQQNDPGF